MAYNTIMKKTVDSAVVQQNDVHKENKLQLPLEKKLAFWRAYSWKVEPD